MNTSFAVIVAASAAWLCSSTLQPSDELADLRDRVAQLEQSLHGDLKVSSIVVADHTGAERIWLRTNASTGEPMISLNDSNGRTRLQLELNHGDAPYIALRDPHSTRVRLEAPIEGAAGLGIWGQGEVNTTSHAGLWVWRDQTIAFGAGLASQSHGSFNLKTSPNGETTFTLRNAANGVTFKAPAVQ